MLETTKRASIKPGIIRPMLATDAIDIPGNPSLHSLTMFDKFWFSQKVDGERLLVVHRGSETFYLNRRGETSRLTIPRGITEDFARLGITGAYDGEYLDGKFYVFDVINGNTSSPYHLRYGILQRIFALWYPGSVEILPVWCGLNNKLQLVEKCRESGAEGIIARNHLASYEMGPSKNLIKWKFHNTLDAVVYVVGRKNKRSLGLAVIDDNGKPQDVGAVTVTDEILNKARVGDVVEIKYLYATDSSKLYQTSFVRFRTDKKPNECSVNQLRYTNKAILPKG